MLAMIFQPLNSVFQVLCLLNALQIAVGTSVITTPPITDNGCRFGAKTSGACTKFTSLSVCLFSSHHQALASCLCNQDTFNVYFDCLSDTRLCFQNNENDVEMFEQASSWHRVCDHNKYFNTTVTTPPTYELTQTLDQDICVTFWSYCADASASVSECLFSQAASPASSQTPCACQPDIVRLDSLCEIGSNKTCLGLPYNTTNLVAYKICPLSDVSQYWDVATANATPSVSHHVLSIPAASTALASGSVPSATAGITGSSTATAQKSGGTDNKAPRFGGLIWVILVCTILLYH